VGGGKLTRDDLREYGQAYYPHVEAFPATWRNSAFASKMANCAAPCWQTCPMKKRRRSLRPAGALARRALLDFVEGMGGRRVAKGRRIQRLQA